MDGDQGGFGSDERLNRMLTGHIQPGKLRHPLTCPSNQGLAGIFRSGGSVFRCAVKGNAGFQRFGADNFRPDFEPMLEGHNPGLRTNDFDRFEDFFGADTQIQRNADPHLVRVRGHPWSAVAAPAQAVLIPDMGEDLGHSFGPMAFMPSTCRAAGDATGRVLPGTEPAF